MFPPGAREAVYEFAADRIRNYDEHDRNGLSCTLRCEGRQSCHCEQYVDIEPDEFISKSVKTLGLFRRKAMVQTRT
jgi:hypothetical protein